MSPPIGVLLMAYGSPASPEQIEEYYTDIRRGRPPSAEQLADLTRRYEAIGGLSPLAERSEAQRARLAAALDELAPGRYRVGLGTKHATPSIEDGVAALVAGGAEQVVGLVLAPHYSALSVGEYLARLRAAGDSHGVPTAAVESWATEPALIRFLARQVRLELGRLPRNTKVLFTAHSLPARVLETGDPYPAEVRATAEAVAAAAGLPPWSSWSIAWQSAGRTPEPWLGPDLAAVIADLAGAESSDGVLVCACGFVADHLEVLYDLDVDAAAAAHGGGLAFARTACVNDDPAVFGALAARLVRVAGGRR